MVNSLFQWTMEIHTYGPYLSLSSFCLHVVYMNNYGAFTLDVKSMLNENLGGILCGTLNR
jgi:hypothetical protein